MLQNNAWVENPLKVQDSPTDITLHGQKAQFYHFGFHTATNL